jgi:tol-pal system protein YbgF
MRTSPWRLGLLVALSAPSFGACGGATTASPAALEAARAAEARAAQLAAAADEQARRIRELESRLALRSAEVRELRAALDEARREPREVVRIGEGRNCAPDDDPELFADESTPEESGPRPVLRLYGSPHPAAFREVPPLRGPVAPRIVAAPPTVASLARLPVTGPAGAADQVPAIPEHPLVIADAPPPEVPRVRPQPTEPDAAVREYLAALAHVEARRWEEALAALARFVRMHPEHPYADNALYWQGEVLYARREYRRAMQTFEALLRHHPRGNKVPDALLRIGHCLERLGDPARARIYFDRVRREHPDSVAARLASQEQR